MNRRSFLLATATVGAAGLAGCIANPTNAVSATFQSATTVTPGTTLQLSNRNGDVTLRQVAGNDVRVEAELRSIRGLEHLERVDIDAFVETAEDVDGNEVSRMIIETVYTPLSNGRDPQVTADVVVNVPEFVVLESVETVNGNLRITDLSGDAELRTLNGDVDVTGIEGVLTLTSNNGDVRARDVTGIESATTTNGAVDVEFASLRDDARFTSTNGDVTVRVPTNLDATVVLRTVNGEAEVRNLPFTTTRNDRRRLEGRIGDGGHLLELESVNGDVTLRGR